MKLEQHGNTLRSKTLAIAPLADGGIIWTRGMRRITALQVSKDGPGSLGLPETNSTELCAYADYTLVHWRHP